LKRNKYGAIAISRDEDNNIEVVSKCDLCRDRDVPAYITHFPNEALVYVEEVIE
jgi:Fe-S-cluster-containing hydrogenase component 2